MKTVLTIIRWFVGLLFIFSGLVKANDPLGLSYKMQEFFEAWGWHALHDYTLWFAVLMNVLEIVAGLAIIIGWKTRLISRVLLLLILFFTFLTGYALLSGKIKACGCFGDCLPLSPAQSFGKDILLLLLILVLLFAKHTIQPATGKPKSLNGGFLLRMTIFLLLAQYFVLRNLPLVDCLPYKKGKDILAQMQTPAGAIPDSFSIIFKYKKNGKIFGFDQANFPDDFDSTYEYVDRTDKLVRKGNNLKAAITDFSLHSLQGNDTTVAVLSQSGKYILVFAKDMDNAEKWKPRFEKVQQEAAAKQIPVTLVTADAEKAVQLFPGVPVLTCDATVIKTAARVNPTYFFMEGSAIRNKVAPRPERALRRW